MGRRLQLYGPNFLLRMFWGIGALESKDHLCIATVQKDWFFFLKKEDVGIPSLDDFVQLCGIHFLRSAQ